MTQCREQWPLVLQGDYAGAWETNPNCRTLGSLKRIWWESSNMRISTLDMLSEFSRLTERCAVHNPSVAWQQLKEIEVSKDPYFQTIRINLADVEKLDYEKKAEGCSRSDLNSLDNNLFSMGGSTAYSVVSGSTIDRSSLFEVNAAEKLNYFIYTNLTIQSNLPSPISSSVCQKAEILNKKETGPYPFTAQKYESPSLLSPPIKTSSLDEVRQFMDQANYVQFMIDQFEKQIESSKRQNCYEKENIEKRARKRAMDQENESAVKKESYNQQDRNCIITKKVSVDNDKQYHVVINEDNILQDNYGCRSQSSYNSMYEDQRTMQSSPNLLQDMMFHANHKCEIHRPPDILEACRTRLSTAYKTSQSNIHELGKGALDMSISNLPLEEKKKEPVAPLNKISCTSNQCPENKTFDVLRLKKSVVNNGPSQRPLKWAILHNPDWRLACHIMDKNESDTWNPPEEKDLNQLWLDFNIVPSTPRLNWMSQRRRCGKGYIIRQHQFIRKALSEDMLWIPEGKCSCLFCVKQKQNFGLDPSRYWEHGYKYIICKTNSSISTLNDTSMKPMAEN